MPDFLLGVNYWPRRSAMSMWRRFDLGEIREDLARMRELGLSVVRFFLLWEAFQPDAQTMSREMLRRFDALMDAVAGARLRAMPTLFCGHMSGVNWLPSWALDPAVPPGRFRTIAHETHVLPFGAADFYADPAMLRAQRLFARRVGERARDHPALYVWDIGNEFSNLREPNTPQDAAIWSALLTETLLESSGAGATGGMHGEDLERERRLPPSSIARPWTFATMHGYSVYATFAQDRLDTDVVPFLCRLQQSFTGKPVLFSEFGNPQCPPGAASAGGFACLNEEEMAQYAGAVLDKLHASGALGGFWWCWADYDPALADRPPFDRAPHELRFGIVRSDESYKPVAQVLASFAREARAVLDPPPPIAAEVEFYASLPQGIVDLYRTYREVYV
jgi:endo-1,4-beta-mannosidase